MDYGKSTATSQNKQIGRITILPSTFIGSPRNMVQRFQDAMTLHFTFGNPDIFLTMTFNPNCREMKENLLPGQQPNDRPELCTRIFWIKVKALLEITIKQNYFGEVAAYVYTIEFQKRG